MALNQDAFSRLLLDFGMFCSMNLVHMEQEARDESSKRELITVIETLGQTSKTFNSFNPAALRKPENRNRILHNIHDTLKYAFPRFKKYLTDEGYKRREKRFKVLLVNYEEAVKAETAVKESVDALLEARLDEGLMQTTKEFFREVTTVLRQLKTIQNNPNMQRTLSMRNLQELRQASDDINNEMLKAKFKKFITNKFFLSKDYAKMVRVLPILNIAVRFANTVTPGTVFSGLFVDAMLDWAATALGMPLNMTIAAAIAKSPAMVTGFRTFLRQFNAKLEQTINGG